MIERSQVGARGGWQHRAPDAFLSIGGQLLTPRKQEAYTPQGSRRLFGLSLLESKTRRGSAAGTRLRLLVCVFGVSPSTYDGTTQRALPARRRNLPWATSLLRRGHFALPREVRV